MTLCAEVNPIAYLVINEVEFLAETEVQGFHSFVVVMAVLELAPKEVEIVNQVAYEEEDILNGFDRA